MPDNNLTPFNKWWHNKKATYDNYDGCFDKRPADPFWKLKPVPFTAKDDVNVYGRRAIVGAAHGVFDTIKGIAIAACGVISILPSAIFATMGYLTSTGSDFDKNFITDSLGMPPAIMKYGIKTAALGIKEMVSDASSLITTPIRALYHKAKGRNLENIFYEGEGYPEAPEQVHTVDSLLRLMQQPGFFFEAENHADQYENPAPAPARWPQARANHVINVHAVMDDRDIERVANNHAESPSLAIRPASPQPPAYAAAIIAQGPRPSSPVLLDPPSPYGPRAPLHADGAAIMAHGARPISPEHIARQIEAHRNRARSV